MKKGILLLVVSFLLFFPNDPPGAAAAAPPTNVVITLASFTERDSALFVAQDQGFFRKHGLDVKLVHVRSGPVALSALSAGESHFYNGSATASTFGAIAAGLDAVFVAGLVNKLAGTFVVKPAIKSPSDLRGKTIGAASIGGGIWMFTMLAFDHWGLDPKRDNMILRIIGDESMLVHALASGIIDGSYLSYTFASRLERQGFRILADLAKIGVPYQGIGILARRSFITSSSDIVENVLRALVEAIGFILQPTNKALVMRSLAKWLRLPQPEDAAEGYERMITLYERRIYPNVEGIRNTIRLLGTTNEKIRGLKAEDIVDERIVKKLEQQGLF